MQLIDLIEFEDLKDLIAEGKLDTATSGVLSLASKYPENQQVKELVTLVSVHPAPPEALQKIGENLEIQKKPKFGIKHRLLGFWLVLGTVLTLAAAVVIR